jgi:hypothetical protein
MTYKAMITKAIATTALVVGAALSPFMPSQSYGGPVVNTATHKIAPLPRPELESIEGLVDCEVSAGIAVEKDRYNVQSNDQFRYHLDVEVLCSDEVGELYHGEILGYEVRAWATIVSEESSNESRDDIFIGQYSAMSIDGTPFYARVPVKSKDEEGNPVDPSDPNVEATEIDVEMRDGQFYTFENVKATASDGRLLDYFRVDGLHAMYTEGYVLIATAEGPVPVAIPGLHNYPSYDTFKVSGTRGNLFAYDSGALQAWLAEGVTVTEGGVLNPGRNTLTNALVVSDPSLMGGKRRSIAPAIGVVYEDKAHWTVLPTKGYGIDGIQILDSAEGHCGEVGTPPCIATMFESTELLAVDVTNHRFGSAKNVEANGLTERSYGITPGDELVAKLAGIEKQNSRTHTASGSLTRAYDAPLGTISIGDRVFGDLQSGLVAVPSWGGMHAVKQTLWGTFGVDDNRDGVIAPNEIRCLEIAHKVMYVQTIPKGPEGLAFGAGVLVGAGLGLLVPTEPTDAIENDNTFWLGRGYDIPATQ